MPPPSQLAIATSSVERLVKEEASYRQELEKQRARVKDLEDNPSSDENAEFLLKQEKQAIRETLAVFPPLRERLVLSVQKLGDQIGATEEGTSGTADSQGEGLQKAKETLGVAEKLLEKGKWDNHA